jgi:hypothetical protein
VIRVVAALVALLGALVLTWGIEWTLDTPESVRPGHIAVILLFGAVALYSGLSVLRRGRL